MIAASYAGCNALLVGCMLAIAVASQGVQISIIMINSIDLSPNFAATIAAVTTSMSASNGLIVPVIVGFLTPNVSYAFNVVI